MIKENILFLFQVCNVMQMAMIYRITSKYGIKSASIKVIVI